MHGNGAEFARITGVQNMTNLEFIRQMDDAELAEFLCDVAACDGCDACIATDHCVVGRNGFKTWLGMERKDDE